MIIIAAVSGPSPRWEPRPSNSDKRTWSRLTLVLWAVIGNVQCCANQTILSDTYPCTPSPPLGAPSSVVWTWFLFFISNELSLVVPSLSSCISLHFLLANFICRRLRTTFTKCKNTSAAKTREKYCVYKWMIMFCVADSKYKKRSTLTRFQMK